MAKQLTYSILIKAINQATAPLRAVTNNFSVMRRAGAIAGKAFDLGGKIGMAQGAVERFGQGAANALKKPIMAFEAYDDQFKKLLGLTGDGAKWMAKYNAEAIKIGKTMGEYDPVDAVRGMNKFANAGYKQQEILDAITPAMNLNSAASGELSDTVGILAGIMAGFSKDASEASNVADILVATFTGSKTTLKSLGETLSYVGSTAHGLGVDFREAAIMAGVLGDASVEGSRAGTAMKTIFSRLVGGGRGGAGKAYLQRLIGKVSDNDMKRPMVLIGRLKSAMAGLGTNKQAAVLSRIFGADAFGEVLTFFDKLDGKRLNELTKAVYGAEGGTAKLAAVMRSSAGNETKQMNSALNVMQQTIGQKLNPGLRDLKFRVIGVSNAMTEFVEKHPTLTKAAGYSTGAVAIFATVLGVALGALALLTTALGVGAVAFGSSATGVQVLGGAFKWLFGLLKYGLFALRYYAVTVVGPALVSAFAAVKVFAVETLIPLLPLIIAIAALAVAGYLVYKNWGPIKTFFKQLFADPLETVKDLKVWMGYLADETYRFFSILSTSPTETLADLAAYARTALPSWAGGLSEEQALASRAIGTPKKLSEKDVEAARAAAGGSRTGGRTDVGVRVTLDQKGRFDDVSAESADGVGLEVVHNGWVWAGT